MKRQIKLRLKKAGSDATSRCKTKCRANGTTPFALLLRLLTDTESCDDRTVSLDVDLDQIVEQRAALTDHLEQTATGVMVLLVDLEVLGEVVDSLSEQSDLNLGRTGVTLMRFRSL